MRVLAGVLPASSGSVVVAGIEAAQDPSGSRPSSATARTSAG
jgi:ABC-type Na+ transport system ATPase subunit NatA